MSDCHISGCPIEREEYVLRCQECGKIKASFSKNIISDLRYQLKKAEKFLEYYSQLNCVCTHDDSS